MSQVNKYTVKKIASETTPELATNDELLIPSYSLGTAHIDINKCQVNATFYTPDGIYLETVPDIKTYSVLGANRGTSATEISLDPVQDGLDRGYLGDIQVEYSVTNNLFSPSHSLDSNAILFIREISTDRTEIRATSTTLSETEIQTYAQDLYRKLNLERYFTGVTLDFFDKKEQAWCINVMTEVIEDDLLVSFKLYEPLPESIDLKSRFTVLERVGEPVRFEVVRTVEILEDEDTSPRLKGPNFDLEVKSSRQGTVTDYLNFQELFSYPSSTRRTDLYSIYKNQGIELNIDHSDFANFIHFSSAAERLENFRYKLTLLQGYEHSRDITPLAAEKVRLDGLISGIIDNFDHYDRYLYYEKTDTSWPKEAGGKPYKNQTPEEAEEWFDQMLQIAQNYDEQNPDILIKTVPQAIRFDSRNEPYLIFVHMIGQHFDNNWLYAKAVATRYGGDNRLDFGLPKDLVQEALTGFGIELETTNQNLEKLFNQCIPGENYSTGSEKSIRVFKRATVTGLDGHNQDIPVDWASYDGWFAPWDSSTEYSQSLNGSSSVGVRPTFGGAAVNGGGGLSSRELIAETDFQPILIDDYRKEVYKRIYHNIPLLLKTKGTSRGLRALISCFGIPEDLLEISVAGNANLDQAGVFFGPEHYTTSSQDRIRLDNAGSKAALRFDETEGSFISGTVLSLNRQIQQPGKHYQPGTNNVEVGFRLNGQFDQKVKDYYLKDVELDPTETGPVGEYVRFNGAEVTFTGWQWGMFDVAGYNVVRFLGRVKAGSLLGNAGFCFLDAEQNFITGSRYYNDPSATVTVKKEYVWEIPAGAKYLKTNIQDPTVIVRSEFYCYGSKTFDYDDIVGDPRNSGEDYGEAFTLLRDQILPELRDSQGNLELRTPTAILRLVRYFDSVLFRTLQTIVPARDEVSTGAIIDDNILHRNRYAGPESLAKNIEETTGSIETVFIDGGEGGCLKVLRGGRPVGKAPQIQSFVIRSTVSRSVVEQRECPTVDYTASNEISIGSEYVTKTVFDDSPKYTGELLGSVEEVTNGELNENNIFKQGGSSFKKLIYTVDFRFLCLPKIPIDTVLNATGINRGSAFEVVGSKQSYISTIGVNGVEVVPNVEGKIIITPDLDTKMIVDCAKSNYQGWILSNNPDAIYSRTNWLGLDEIRYYPYKGYISEDILNELLSLDKNRLYSGSRNTIVLPLREEAPKRIVSGLGTNLEQEQIWKYINQNFTGNRVTGPRLVGEERLLENTSLQFTLLPEEWDRVLGIPLNRVRLGIGYKLTSQNSMYLLRFSDLKNSFPDQGVTLLYVYISSQDIPDDNDHFDPNLGELYRVKVLDVAGGMFRDWDDDTDFVIWEYLKGWETSTISFKKLCTDYFVGKYLGGESKVIGVAVQDSNSSNARQIQDPEVGTKYPDKYTMIESYMGTPYVFTRATQDKTLMMQITNW